jgi:threonine dehydrogenase-like Zn-dependent dehydrogenase
MHGAGDVRIETVPDAHLDDPADALVRVTRACICGSDLWPYADMEPSETGQSMGHEAIGVVEDVGAEVRTVKPGDLVIMPFAFSDGTCAFCHEGLNTACVHVGFFGNNGINGAQAEALRVPFADGTLFPLNVGEDDGLMTPLLTLSDVMGTGHHAAVVAGVRPGDSIAVVGDGAVGLCGVIAAKRLGAAQIIIMGRHEERTGLARELGATDVVAERGEAAVQRVHDLTRRLRCARRARMRRDRAVDRHLGADRTARRRDRPGRRPALSAGPTGPAAVLQEREGRGWPSARGAYIEELLPDILEGRIEPGKVFDQTVNLDGVPAGYRAMAQRESIKVMVTP